MGLMFPADVLSDSTRGDDDTSSLISSDTTLSPLMSPTPSMGPMTYPGTNMHCGSGCNVVV